MQDLGDLMKNGPWIALFLVTTFYFIALMIRGSVMLPYFKYCAGNQMLFSWFNGFGLTALLIGVACSTALTKRIGKRMLFFWSMLLTGVFCIALLLFPATATSADRRAGSSAPIRLRLLRPGAVVDDGRRCRLRRMEDGTPRHRYGDRGGGLCAVDRIGSGRRNRRLAPLVLWLSVQCVVRTEIHNAQCMGIRLIAAVWSGAAFLAAAVCLLFYGISMKLNLTISNELAERRKGFSSSAS